MKDAKELELIEARDEAYSKWIEDDHKWDEACRKRSEAYLKRCEADLKRDEADRKLREYRKSKAQQGGRLAG